MTDPKQILKTLDWGKGYIIVRITDKTASICSVTGTPMQVSVEANYIPEKKILEFVSFREYLKEVSKGSYTAEELAVKITQDLYNVIEPVMVMVSVKVNTLEHGPVEIIAMDYDLVKVSKLFNNPPSIPRMSNIKSEVGD